MAIGGSFDPSTFTNRTPFETWAQVQGIGLYWDTENTFAAGKQGVRSASFGAQAPMQGRQGVRSLDVSAPMRGYSPARAQPVNMFGSARNISSGGRDYGSQAIDRGELQRLSSMGSSFVDIARQRAENAPGQTMGPRTPSARQQRRQLRRAGVPMPPQPGQVPLPPPSMPEEPETGFAPPGGVPGLSQPPQTQQATKTLPAPVPATPHALAGTNWREVQAQRIAELELGEPGQPAPNPSVGSRSYLEEVERRRAERAGLPPAPTAPPLTGAQRMERAGQLQAERQAAVAARGGRGPMPPGAVSNRRSPDLLPPNMRPGAVGTAKIPTPMGLAGGQEERLSAEGATPAAPPKRTRKKS